MTCNCVSSQEERRFQEYQKSIGQYTWEEIDGMLVGYTVIRDRMSEDDPCYNLYTNLIERYKDYRYLIRKKAYTC